MKSSAPRGKFKWRWQYLATSLPSPRYCPPMIAYPVFFHAPGWYPLRRQQRCACTISSLFSSAPTRPLASGKPPHLEGYLGFFVGEYGLYGFPATLCGSRAFDSEPPKVPTLPWPDVLIRIRKGQMNNAVPMNNTNQVPIFFKSKMDNSLGKNLWQQLSLPPGEEVALYLECCFEGLSILTWLSKGPWPS